MHLGNVWKANKANVIQLANKEERKISVQVQVLPSIDNVIELKYLIFTYGQMTEDPFVEGRGGELMQCVAAASGSGKLTATWHIRFYGICP